MVVVVVVIIVVLIVVLAVVVVVVLRGNILNRTYGRHKKLYISQFSLTIFCPTRYLLWSPVIVVV